MNSVTTTNDDQVDSGLHALLKHPSIYSFFQRLMGSHYKYRTYINEFMKPSEGSKILDIGCGTADILNFLPSNVNYVGYDMSQKYINYARKKYGHRAKFYNQSVSEMNFNKKDLFDIIMCYGLLHHLNDAEARKLFKIGYKALKDKGLMITFDPVYIGGQNFIARFINHMDRGKHIRYPLEYKEIASSMFSRIDINIINKIGTGCILKCYII